MEPYYEFYKNHKQKNQKKSDCTCEEYKYFAFCKSVVCPYLAYSCTVENCIHTAKEFHMWLLKNGYKIIKEN